MAEQKKVIKMRKTVVIGIGGTGCGTIMEMKKRYIRMYGEVPPLVKFFVFDTDDPPPTSGKEYELKPNEFFKLRLSATADFIKVNSEVRAWWTSDMKLPATSLTSGAGQIRPMGRLAMFANAKDVSDKIEHQVVGGIKSYKVGTEEKMNNVYEPNQDVVYYNLVGSFSGGTGSGAFLDLAMLLRKSMDSDSDKLDAYFVLPDIFKKYAGTANVEPNAYAALKEIDNLMMKIEYPGEYSFAGKIDASRIVQKGLFNSIYLVNKFNENGVEIDNIQELYQAMALGIIFQSAAAGKSGTSTLDNLEKQANSMPWDGGKRALYMSLGMSELVLPVEWFAKMFKLKAAENVCRETCFDMTEDDAETILEEFIAGKKLREDGGNNREIVSSILPDGQFKKLTPLEKPSSEAAAKVMKDLATHFGIVEKDLLARAGNALESRKAEQLAAIREKIESMLLTPKMVIPCEDFVKSLRGRFDGYIAELRKRIEMYQGQLKSSVASLEGTQARLKQASDSFMVGRANRIQSGYEELQRAVDNRSRIMLEKMRAEKAIDLLTFLNAEVDRWSVAVNTFYDNIDSLKGEYQKERFSMTSSHISPFVKELRPKSMLEREIKDASAADFLKWLKGKSEDTSVEGRETYDFLSFFAPTATKEEISAKLLEFAVERPDIRELRTMRLVDVLAEFKEQCKKDKSDEFEKLQASLDQMCAPLWRLQKQFISGEKQIETIYIIGNVTESSDDQPFNLKELKSNQAPTPVATQDQERMVFLKISGKAPAYILKNIEDYKEIYERRMKQSGRIAYHLHKEWDRLDGPLADLIPEVGAADDEAGMWWAVANTDVFNIIYKEGNFYYMYSDKKGTGMKKTFKLDQGRVQAMQKFLKNGDLCQEALESIEKKRQQLGADTVKSKLQEYVAKTRSNPEIVGSSLEAQMTSELEQIDRYISKYLAKF